MNLAFREVQGQAEREAVMRLRYRIHVAELGKPAADADHDRELLFDRHDAHSVLLAAFSGDDPVGTVRLTCGTLIGTHDPWWRFYNFDAYAAGPDCTRSVTSRLMVLPELRGTLVAAQLLAMAYQRGRELGTVFNFMHCAPGLVAVHEQMGFRRYTYGAIDAEVGYRVPLVLVADDHAYLDASRSPFASLARKYPADPRNGQWFAERFAALCQPSTGRTLGPSRIAALINDSGIRSRCRVLADIGDDDLAVLLESAVVHLLAPGFRVQQRGMLGGDLFVILAGHAMLGDDDDPQRRRPVIGPGDSFGDYPYLSGQPAVTSVEIIEPATVISFSHDSLGKLQRKQPALAFRLVLNLAKATSHRLDASITQGLDA